MADVHGSCDDRFSGVRDALARQLDAEELGASIAVDLDGETVVDLWGGLPRRGADDALDAGHHRQRLVDDEDGALAGGADAGGARRSRRLRAGGQLLAGVLGEGEEGCRGAAPDVAHVGRLRLGPAVLDAGHVRLGDVHRAAGAAAAVVGAGHRVGLPRQQPGAPVGEVIRRITGTTFKQFVADEIAKPLGADFQIGARESDWDRIAPVVPPPPLDIDPRRWTPSRSWSRPTPGRSPSAKAAKSPEWRRADMGALNGHSQRPRRCCDVLRALSLGGRSAAGGCCRTKTIDLMFDQQSDGVDLVLGEPFRFGIGYCLGSPDGAVRAGGAEVCFWGGWGGSMIVMDLDRRLTISYMMNRMARGHHRLGPRGGVRPGGLRRRGVIVRRPR